MQIYFIPLSCAYAPVGWFKRTPTGSLLSFNLTEVNNNSFDVNGGLIVKLLNTAGKTVSEKHRIVVLKPFNRTDIMESLSLPLKPGGYLVVAEFTPAGTNNKIISRRYIRIGGASTYEYYNLQTAELLFPERK